MKFKRIGMTYLFLVADQYSVTVIEYSFFIIWGLGFRS